MVRITVPPELDAESTRTLADAIARASEDAGARVIVLEGKDGTFCRGMSFRAFTAERAGAATREGVQTLGVFAECLRAIRLCGKATIALVGGEAVAGGVGLAAACDLIIAADEASFAFSEALFGMTPAMILPFLLERMPAQKARLMALSGHGYSAVEASALGLVDVVTPRAQLERALERWRRRFMRAAPRATAILKTSLPASAALDLTRGLAHGVACSAAALNDACVAERIRVFQGGDLPWRRP